MSDKIKAIEPTTAEIRKEWLAECSDRVRNYDWTCEDVKELHGRCGILLDRLQASELERHAAIQSAVVSEEQRVKAEQTIADISELVADRCGYVDCCCVFCKIKATIGSKKD